ncbi:MAG: hypothetical protein JRE10_07835 [Deltaproteobacteria bacterium]|nr:hypothetical protein [Deltaproteobacteria bacterium]
MTVNTVVDKKALVVIHTVAGEITFEEIKSSYESVCSHPDFQENMNSIWDIRAADASKFDIGIWTIKKVSGCRSRSAGKNWNFY